MQTPSERRKFLASLTALIGNATLADRALAQANLVQHDLVIKNGQVLDPARGINARADIGIRNARIAALEPDIPTSHAKRVIDAGGKLVTPGLIDLHTHIYPGATTIGVSPEELVRFGSVTTAVSAGDCGARDVPAFKRYVRDRPSCRVYAFVNIAAGGLTGYPAAELVDLEQADGDAAARAVAEHHDIVLGISVRQSRHAVGANGLEPLKRAIAATERAGTRGRVMCQIGDVPDELAALLDLLRPRDILTRTYSGAGNEIVRNGKLLDAAVAARKRGVVIGVGHGIDGFDYRVAEAALAQGLPPDVLSSGIQARAGRPGGEPLLAHVMSKFLNMGLTLEQVVAMATVNPARIIGREPKLGTLDLGAPADVSILELVEAPVQFSDAGGNRREGNRWLKPVQAVRAGIALGNPRAMLIR